MVINSQVLEISNLNNQPILTLRTGSCKIQTGNINIIHPINITEIEITVDLLSTIAYKNSNNFLTHIVKHKIKELYSNLIQIKPQKHRRQRSIEMIGTAWKWIGGSPDAEDLRILNQTMNELIESNNQQYKVNEELGKRLQILTNAINKVIESKNRNQIMLDEIEVLSTIIKIDTINKLLENIQEAIMLSKASLASNKILSLKEIYTIRTLLEEQGIAVDLPDEALNLVKPRIAINANTLLYITRVPQLGKEEAQVIRIAALNQDGQIIKHHPDYIIKSRTNFYSTSKPKEYIQQRSFLQKISDTCITPLLAGTKSKCTRKKQTRTEILELSNNLILINYAKGGFLNSDFEHFLKTF